MYAPSSVYQVSWVGDSFYFSTVITQYIGINDSVLYYENLYWQFGCNLWEEEGLIKKSASFKIHLIPHTLIA